MGTREDFEGMAELVQFFGWRRATEIVGACFYFAARRAQPEDFKSAPAHSTAWTLRKDLLAFRQYMEAKGKGRFFAEEDDPADGVIRMLTEGGEAA